MQTPLAHFVNRTPQNPPSEEIDFADFMKVCFSASVYAEKDINSMFDKWDYYSESVSTDNFDYVLGMEVCSDLMHFTMKRIKYKTISENGREITGDFFPSLDAGLVRCDNYKVKAETFRSDDIDLNMAGVGNMHDLLGFIKARKLANSPSFKRVHITG